MSDRSPKKPPLDGGEVSKPKKGGFITDQEMWNVTLDLAARDTIDFSTLPEQGAEEVEKPPKEDEAGSIIANKPKPTVKASTPLNQSRRIERAPVQKPLPPKKLPKRPNPRKIQNAQSTQPSAQMRAEMLKRQRLANQRTVAPAQNRPVRKNPTRPLSDSHVAPSREPIFVETEKSFTETSVYTTKDVSDFRRTQDVSEVMTKVKRERSVARIVKLGILVLKNWLAILTLVIGFAAGYKYALMELEKNQHKMLASQQQVDKNNSISKKSVKPAKANVKKAKLKVKERKARPKKSPVAITPEKIKTRNTSGENEVPVVVVDDYQQPETFSGIDIPLNDNGEIKNNDPGPELNDRFQTQPSIKIKPRSAPVQPIELPKVNIKQLMEESLMRFENKQWSFVIELSDQILHHDSSSIAALINRSVAHTELKSYTLAINDANLILSIDPNHAVAINNRGNAYELMGNIKEAMQDYKRACDLGIPVSCQEYSRLNEHDADTEDL